MISQVDNPLTPLLTIANKEFCTSVLKAMYLARFSDEKMSKLVRQNKGGTFYMPSSGHELIGTVSALCLTSGKDWGLPYYRDRAFAIGLGCDLKDLFGVFLARKVDHHSGGRMMPEHFSHKALHMPCQSSCVGSQFLHAVGVAKALQLDDKDEVVYVSAGDGSTSQGDFHEALNFSCIHKLGVIFVIQDNGWAISVPACEQTAGSSIASFVQGYDGLSVTEVDGCDFEQVVKTMRAAVEKGRCRLGPSVIIAKVPRMGPHSSSDDPTKYKDEQTLAQEKLKDPLPIFEEWLLKEGWDQSEMDTIKKLAYEQVEHAAQVAETYPFESKETVLDHVFKKEDPIVESLNANEAESVVMVDALNHALDEEMQRDPKITVFGQDVAHGKGGVFGVTRHLTAKHGTERCFNSPLAESTIIGVATGMSFVEGHRPVVEIQFADYLWTGINQLFNELASIHYRSNGEWNCPVVVRMPYGGYIQGGPYHSQSIEAFLSHCPGLKVVIPSNAQDAKRLLKAAILDPNPVVFLEHKALYRQRVFCARPEPAKEDLLPLGKACIVRQGKDVTLVAWGMTVFMGIQAADALAQEGITVEIVDLRTLVPLDMDTVIASVAKTGKVLIAHEAPSNCGFGAEVATRIVEQAFDKLDAPIARVTGKNCPVPYAKALEDAVLPQAKDLEDALRKLAHF